MTVAQAEWIKLIASTIDAFEGFDGCLITSVHHSTGEQGGDVLMMVRGTKADVPLRIKPDGTVLNVVSSGRRACLVGDDRGDQPCRDRRLD